MSEVMQRHGDGARRVLVLNHFAKTPDAPGGNRHYDLFTRLPGWEVSVLAADRNNMAKSRQTSTGSSPVRFVPTVGGRSSLGRVLNWVSYAITALVIGLRGPTPDVVYASSPHLLAGLSGWMIARARRAAFVLEVRDIWPRILVDMGTMSESSVLYRSLLRLEAFLYRSADVVVHLAAGNCEYLIDHKVGPDRLHFIPNSVAPSATEPSRTDVRTKLGLDGTVAIYTGAHGRANGLDHLLSAARDLASEENDLLVVLVGDGTEKDRLVRRAQDESIENVRFLDPVPKRELPDLYAAADLGVHVLEDVPLFRHGVSPNKIMDYMAAGLPIVTNSPGEAGDVVLDAQAGIVADPLELAHGIRQLLGTSPVERKRMGDRGLRYVQEHRNPDLMAQRLKRALDNALLSHG